MPKTTCSKCGAHNPRAPAYRYCLPCHARYMREHRPRHRALPEQAKRRANARSYANVYIKRGKLARRGCDVCGALAEMHHDDYSRPLAVRWFCRAHHLEFHR